MAVIASNRADDTCQTVPPRGPDGATLSKGAPRACRPIVRVCLGSPGTLRAIGQGAPRWRAAQSKDRVVNYRERPDNQHRADDEAVKNRPRDEAATGFPLPIVIEAHYEGVKLVGKGPC